MNCADRESLISAMADGELHGLEEDELQTHMASCPKCRQVYAEMLSLQSGLESAFFDCGEVPDIASRIVLPASRKPFYVWWIPICTVAAALVFVFFATKSSILQQKPNNMARLSCVHTSAAKVAAKPARRDGIKNMHVFSMTHRKHKNRSIRHELAADIRSAAEKPIHVHRKNLERLEESPTAVENGGISVTYEDEVALSTVPNVSQYLAAFPEYKGFGTVIARKGRADEYLLPSQKFDIAFDWYVSADDDNSM